MRLRTLLLVGMLGLATIGPGLADKTIEGQITADKTADTLQGCSFACATDWKTAVSWHLPAASGIRYDAACLEDGNEKTAWASHGKGDWLETTFTGRGKEWKSPLRALRIINGYAKSPEIWKKNARVKTLRMERNGQDVATIHLQDSPNVQSVSFDEIEIHPKDKVRLTILEVYPGTASRDTCISEIIWDGAH